MKLFKTFFLLFLVTTIAFAGPRRHYHRHYPTRYYSHPHSYFALRYQAPIYYTTVTKTVTQPGNLVTVTTESVATDISRLQQMHEKGMISDREFSRGKKTLLNRIGMSINPNASGLNSSEVLDQIDDLYQLHREQILTRKEFEKQKDKLLALL